MKEIPGEADLVQAAVRGNEEAFRGLMERNRRLVTGVAWRYGTRAAEVEDVVSEVFIKMYQNLHRYRPDHAFSTWLYRLAANHVIDHGRRARREQGRVEMPEQIADPSQQTERSLEEQERSLLVRNGLEELEDTYRGPLFLVYIEGLKVREAAQTLGLPVGTVKTRLMRGRKALARVLTRRHPDIFGDPDAM
jgi:RNA polymerase sigma factor (sigma-70 family)